MASGQPDYTRQVAVTVFDPPDNITVEVENTATPVNVAFPSLQDVNIAGQDANIDVNLAAQDAAITTTPSVPYIAGRTAAFEDAAFVTGSSPATHDVNAALGRNSHDGYIHNAGSGDLQYNISDNGTDYGGTHTLKAGAKVKLTGLDIDSIKITWVADTVYYIMVV